MKENDDLLISAQPVVERPPRYGREFYRGVDTVSLARALLGSRLVTSSRGTVTSGMIVEVEAYLGSDDPACHAARGKTARNAVMFEAAGHCYVYLIYGMYLCMNVVSDPEDVGSGVLLRAVEPLEGVAAMQRRRSGGRSKVLPLRDLARGPGRLCQALGISRGFGGEHFATSSRLWIEPYKEIPAEGMACSGRIGITAGAELPLRFYVKDSPWVSGNPR
jgi:DNA-3-methyladenine glycosylase